MIESGFPMGDALLNVVGRRDPLRGMKFEVTFPKLGGVVGSVGFSKISGISQESDVIEYREGDEPIVQRKIPGLIKVGDVTLERGVANVNDMRLLDGWRNSAATPLAGRADGITNYRHPVNISAISREGVAEWGVQLVNAWPRKIEYGDLDANSSDIWIVTFTLAYEQFITQGEVPAFILQLFPSPAAFI